MRSIPTIFCYDKETHLVTSRPLQMVKWVFESKGTATRQYDGVAIKVERGKVYRRFEWKANSGLPPVGFEKVQDFNPKRPNAPIPGWVPIPMTFFTKPNGTDEKALREAWHCMLLDVMKVATKDEFANKWTVTKTAEPMVPDGTYELCGPKIRGNQEGLTGHRLIRHGSDVVKKVPRTFEGLKKFLETYEGEGIVWHYQTNGGILMAKIKRSDFGFNTRITKQDLEMAYSAPIVEEKTEEPKEASVA
jgi:hypothetical protein